jgi:hypothetical protein
MPASKPLPVALALTYVHAALGIWTMPLSNSIPLCVMAAAFVSPPARVKLLPCRL